MTTQKMITRKKRSSTTKKSLPKPRTVRRKEAPQRTVLTLDCSGSSAIKDIKPNRLGAEKASSIEFMKERAARSSEDEIAVVSYHTDARIECSLQPMTKLSVVTKAINRIKLGNATAIGHGLEEAEKALTGTLSPGLLSRFCRWFDDTPEPQSKGFLRRVILLTDGHHGCGTDPLPIAVRLKRAGVQIDCIGIGGCESAVDEYLLKKIASIDAPTA